MEWTQYCEEPDYDPSISEDDQNLSINEQSDKTDDDFIYEDEVEAENDSFDDEPFHDESMNFQNMNSQIETIEILGNELNQVTKAIRAFYSDSKVYTVLFRQ